MSEEKRTSREEGEEGEEGGSEREGDVCDVMEG